MASSGSDKLVVAVLADWRMAPISEKMRHTLGFLEKLTTAPTEVGPADVEPARLAGVSDQALEEAIYVCFLFSVMDRLADALDFEIHSAEGFQIGGRVLASRGYGGLSLPG